MSGVEDPDNPRLTVEDIKAIMSYDPESEVDRLDEELQRQIQWKLEACKKAEDLQSKVNEMEQVLTWATDNVWRIEPHRKDIGGWFCISNPRESQEGPTLYSALYEAWKAREVKP